MQCHRNPESDHYSAITQCHRNHRNLRICRRSNYTILLSVALVVLSTLCWPLTGQALESFYDAIRAYRSGDTSRTIQLLEQKVLEGSSNAEALLGRVFLEQGVNIDRAINLIKNATEKGVAEAEFLLGSLHGQGKYVKQSSELFRLYIERSAENGHPLGQYIRGHFYKRGELVPFNAERALFWFNQSLRQGYAPAKAQIVTYDYWSDRRKDEKEFISRLIEFSKEGFPEIQYVLGFYYDYGRIVKVDKIKAMTLYLLSSYQGHEHAKQNLEILKSFMEPRHLNEAKRIAENWLLSAATRQNTYFGKAAKWCFEEQSLPLDCLKMAVGEHNSCYPPYFPNYFSNFTSSDAYRRCRRSQ